LNQATAPDIDLLIMRRKEECREFHEKFNHKVLNDKQYMIDIEWFLNWKCFVTNDLSERFLSNSKKLISNNQNIGVLAPGPLSNQNLIDNQKNVKKNLKNVKINLNKNEDYVTVNDSLWKFFMKNYGGGPEVPLKTENATMKIIMNSPSELKKNNLAVDKKLNKQYSTMNDKNKIVIKDDCQNYIQETKVEPFETESIRNDECTCKQNN
jgi:hypothetical protein